MYSYQRDGAPILLRKSTWSATKSSRGLQFGRRQLWNAWLSRKNDREVKLLVKLFWGISQTSRILHYNILQYWIILAYTADLKYQDTNLQGAKSWDPEERQPWKREDLSGFEKDPYNAGVNCVIAMLRNDKPATAPLSWDPEERTLEPTLPFREAPRQNVGMKLSTVKRSTTITKMKEKCAYLQSTHKHTQNVGNKVTRQYSTEEYTV